MSVPEYRTTCANEDHNGRAPLPTPPTHPGPWRLLGPPVVTMFRKSPGGLYDEAHLYVFYWEKVTAPA